MSAAILLCVADGAAAQVVYAKPPALAEATRYDEPLTTGSYGARRPGAPAQAGQYGGGFIELLMTGRDPTPYVRPLRPDPFSAGAASQMRSAALSDPAAEPTGIRRVVEPRFQRQLVDYDGPQGPGTIVIHTPTKYLYLVLPGAKAIRYGIGVGRPGFEWAGTKTVTRKAEWPDWTPPSEMLKRRPDLPRYMAGGPDNPMGARALYLGSSLYRIHGTNEPWTIGYAVSSGCIRMMNDDVVDLYEKVRVGSKVIVI
jgi:lipoprotein-anchoring transpeptidase ErfK/SrfK